MFDPWQAVVELVGWTVVWQPLKTKGLTRWRHQTIVLDPGLTVAQQRAVLTHELVHARRGPTLRRLRAREEATVRREAALLLIDLVHLADAAAWSRWRVEVADELWVDVATLDVRLELLTPDERAWIDARVALIHLP
jgi:hypothetical protein